MYRLRPHPTVSVSFEQCLSESLVSIIIGLIPLLGRRVPLLRYTTLTVGREKSLYKSSSDQILPSSDIEDGRDEKPWQQMHWQMTKPQLDGASHCTTPTISSESGRPLWIFYGSVNGLNLTRSWLSTRTSSTRSHGNPNRPPHSVQGISHPPPGVHSPDSGAFSRLWGILPTLGLSAVEEVSTLLDQ